MHENALAMCAVLGSIVSLTVGTSYGKQLFPVIGAGGTAAYRVVFAAVILLAVWRPWRQRIARTDLIAVTIYGVTLGLMNFVFYQAIARLPLGVAIAIEFTGPLVVAVVSSRRLVDFVWIALTLVGLALLLPINAGTAAQLDPVGIAFAFASALAWGLYIVFGKRVAHLPAGISTSLGMGVAALSVMPLAFAESGARLVQPSLLPAGIALAIASSALPYTLEMFALKRLPKNTFGILLSMEPAVGAVTGYIVLHEVLTWTQWAAIACIMSASMGSTFGAKSAGEGAGKDVTAGDVPADVL